jgi:hypothetical protein
MHRNCANAFDFTHLTIKSILCMSAWSHVDLNSNNIWGDGPLYGIIPYTTDRTRLVPASIRRIFTAARKVRFAEVPGTASDCLPEPLAGDKRKRCGVCFQVGHNSRTCKHNS